MTGDNYGMGLFPQHAEMLAASGISPERARERRYRSVDTKVNLEHYKIAQAGRRVPGLLVPMLRVDGSEWGYQYRPDSPRERGGKPVKYETPVGQRNGIDFPPGVADMLADLSKPLWITEGVKKADSAVQRGLCCVSLQGVWSWKGKPGKETHESSVALADFDDVGIKGRGIVLAFDSDVMVKPAVRNALERLARFLEARGAAEVRYLLLPDNGDGKTGLDDFLAVHEVADLARHVRKELPPPEREPAPVRNRTPEPAPRPAHPPATLDQVHAVFRRWLGADYDTDALDVVLAAAAVERLDGDPLWLLLLSGSGNAKTETVQALADAGAIITSTISSPGALLSATSQKERASDATGGLLRKVEPRGLLVIKDVTSILSMNRDMRAEVLGALREVYDGRWSRNVGTDGGRTLEWAGRVTVVGAVTTAWDRAHDVIASMGDRFVIVRMDSHDGRQAAGRRAIGNTGSEVQMRAELAAVVAGLLDTTEPAGITVTEEETDVLLAAADVVTLARTGVEYDYRGDVIDAHAPEMPTRFAKQLTQVVRGAVALGMDRRHALRLAIRCARDSMPPLRLAILDDVAAHPDAATKEVRKRLGKPRATVDRQLQALNMLGVIEVDEEETEWAGRPATVWRYRLADGIEPTALDPESVPDLSVPTPTPLEEEPQSTPEGHTPQPPTDISGTDPTRCTTCGNRLHLGECIRCLTMAATS